ncbi:MAG: GAF domain-containing protein [Chloroflexi bacterium]|nr:GAF domain-containing protein [Chloroflexota bacterium]
MQAAVEAAREIPEAQYAALAEVDASGSITAFWTSGITPEERAAMGPLPQGRGLLGAVIREREPVRVQQISGDKRTVGFPPNHPAMASFLGVPILLGEEVLGHLYVTNRRGAKEFTDEDQWLLELLAGHAALTIDNARRYAREVAARRLAEQERQRLRTFLDNIPEAAILLDRTGRLVQANGAAPRLFLGHDEDLAGMQYPFGSTVLQPDGAPWPAEDVPVLRAIRRGDSCLGVQAILLRQDSTRIPILVNASPLWDEGGEVAGAVAVVQDITPLLAEEKAKEQFLTMVAHDLRNPLTVIKALASELLMSPTAPDPATFQERIQSINQHADYLNDMVGNLLEMSRIGAGALSLDLEECHMADVVEEALRRVERLRAETQHQVLVEVAPGLPACVGDFDQLVRVLGNLLQNAMDYSQPRSSVRVTAVAAPGPPPSVRLEVRDQGIGIAPADQVHLFQQFPRIRSTMARRRPGVGLGLALCKALVEAHHGHVGVQSEVAKGSTFFFEIPLTQTQGA